MRVLFLDIDGVLNSRKFIMAVRNGQISDRGAQIDPERVYKLKRVLDAVPDLKIVISSSWRIGRTLEELKQLLPAFMDEIIGKTPSSPDDPEEEGRGYEILDWLKYHPEVTSYVVLDDEQFDMGPVMDCLVKTPTMGGIRDEDVETIIKIFEDK